MPGGVFQVPQRACPSPDAGESPATDVAAAAADQDGDTEESDYDPFAADAAAAKPPEGAAAAADEDTEPEDEDYDPFAADGAAPGAAAAPMPAAAAPPAGGLRPGGRAAGAQPADAAEDEEDDDDGTAFNALIELLRAAEQPPDGAAAAGPKAPPPGAFGAPSAGPVPLQPPGPGFTKASAPRHAPGPAVPAYSKAGAPAAARPLDTAAAARPLDTGEEVKPKRAKPAVEYEYNPATQRWEPAKSKGDVAAVGQAAAPKGAGRAAPAAAPQASANSSSSDYKTRPSRTFQQGYAHHRMAEADPRGGDPRPRKSYIIAECEAEARADAANGLCEFMQALAVRLALRFESRPSGILSSMAEAGLPAAKDQRSTVKAIMRLCHPDKCKHPEAKRAMQILSPLL